MKLFAQNSGANNQDAIGIIELPAHCNTLFSVHVRSD
jgi:hypothetical protein